MFDEKPTKISMEKIDEVEVSKSEEASSESSTLNLSKDTEKIEEKKDMTID